MNNKVLIVDDEPRNLKIINIRLNDNYELFEACCGEDAIELAIKHQPSIVLLDIMMDGLDGYEVTRILKNNKKTEKTKIILVSSKALIEEKIQGYSEGADDYLIKPFNGEELKAKVKVFNNLYNLEQQLEHKNRELENEVLLRSEQLLKSERMAYVGLHSAEIVHNLKNPITIIKGYIASLKEMYPEIDQLNKVEEANTRIFEIANNILTSFSNDPIDDMAEIDINEIIANEVDFIYSLSPANKKKYGIKLDLFSKNSFFGRKVQFSQIIGNIIKNSIEAMEDSHEKKIHFTTADLRDYIIIKITDTGSGIEKELLKKIFDPQFTTKTGKNGGPIGNGLGLSYTKKVIETYGGKLELTSTVGKGTTTVIKLPLLNPALTNTKL